MQRMTWRRVSAVIALIAAVATVALAVLVALGELVRVLVLVVVVGAGLSAGWYGLLRRGFLRWAAWVFAAVALAVAALLVLTGGNLLGLALVVGCALVWVAAARVAFRVHVPLPPVPAPARPVLFVNPRSGGGKAARFALVDEAHRRGIDTVELRPGDDLETLVRQAVTGGADALAAAGGDGSQAIVAAVAAEYDLPYACIPAGTRNHFALDLGVDRDDVVGALDAFVNGGEHRVDIGEVNGRVFVNNVSLGVYAQAVQRPGYRDAKLRTLLETVPDVIGPDAEAGETGLRWTGPGGHPHQGAAVILVSNNRYRLGRPVGAGTRPRIDDGKLGVTLVGTAEVSSNSGHGLHVLQRPWREWSAQAFEVDCDAAVPAGVDGEAAVLTAPVRFRIRPGVLRARVALSHPGASPSAHEPDSLTDGARALVRIAAGKDIPRQRVPD